MRIIGLDLGTKTMGIAVTDSLKIIASGVENFEYPNNNTQLCINRILKLLDYYVNDVEMIVLGYPTNVNGTKNERTLYIERFFDLLKLSIPSNVQVKLYDEKYTTRIATGMLKYQAGLKNSQIKKIKDKMSAVAILQSYLDTQH
jgi:putative Holliday junction resolvase